MQRTDILERKEEILQWIEEHQTKAFICKQLNCKPDTLNSYLGKMGIDYKGNQGSKGQPSKTYKTAQEYVQSEYINTHALKLKLFKEGIKEKKCELCGYSEWIGYEIPFELHHKDNNHFNNDFDNLQILCPTCHAILTRQFTQQIKEEQGLNKGVCIDCGAPISAKAKRCQTCANRYNGAIRKAQNTTIPSREELKKLIRNTPFTHIALQYKVTDKAITKWCLHHNLPSRKKEIVKYSDEEWNMI